MGDITSLPSELSSTSTADDDELFEQTVEIVRSYEPPNNVDGDDVSNFLQSFVNHLPTMQEFR